MSEDNEKKHPENEETSRDSLPAEDRAGEPLEEALRDPGMEALKKYAPFIVIFAIAVFGIFALVQWRASSQRESQELLNQDYLKALALSESGDPGGLLAFARKYDEDEEPLVGVSLYRAASLQYANADFETAAATFGRAAALLGAAENPLALAGRSILGQAVSLIKADNATEGKALLRQLAPNNKFVASVRSEAWHHLGIQALTEGDETAYQQAAKALAADNPSFEQWSELLSQRKSSSDLIGKARKRRKVHLAEKNLEAGLEFLAENKKREGVVTLESGLQYEVMSEGNGTSPNAEDTVEVHYHGTLVNGEVFDSSVERGQPSKFGLTGVIAGWTEGIPLMKEGGKHKFFIPSSLAYKELGKGDIGPNEALMFEVELLKVFPK
ncbi:MAG: FKBP-type peptidyl-prolyl cis-trans isomerase, partial [Opitutales bacterium]